MSYAQPTPQPAPERLGDWSLKDIIRTNDLYGKDGFWLGPRGRDDGNRLPDPKPYQHANLYPDRNASYWFGLAKLPKGTELTLRGKYPYARYFQLAVYRQTPDGQVESTDQWLADEMIKPDKGSSNPFAPSANRYAEPRSYTVRIVAEDVPPDPARRAPNTLYTGAAGDLTLIYRVYLPDIGRDGSGDTGLPSYEAKLPDGKVLPAKEVVKQLGIPFKAQVPAGMTVEQWRALKKAPDNDPALKAATAPARNPPVWEKYINNEYTLIGVFKTPEARAKLSQKILTGLGGDPKTQYLMCFVNRKFRPVLVVRGKMPTFPNTYVGKDGKGAKEMTSGQFRYWSIIQSEAPPAANGSDGLIDMQVPLDADRNYTLVMSLPEDRPANATEKNGIAWIHWGTSNSRRAIKPSNPLAIWIALS